MASEHRWRKSDALHLLRSVVAWGGVRELIGDDLYERALLALDKLGEAVTAALSFGYADPPYPGCAHLYADHPDYDGEVDHELLLRLLDDGFDGWCLHTSSVALGDILGLAAKIGVTGFRVMAWVKPFAAFKRNVSVAYAWEPVLVKAGRKPVVKPGMTYRDWIAESITLKKGLTGAKPPKVCTWLFEVMGCEQQDELHDLFPGTGAVKEAWELWSSQTRLAV